MDFDEEDDEDFPTGLEEPEYDDTDNPEFNLFPDDDSPFSLS